MDIVHKQVVKKIRLKIKKKYTHQNDWVRTITYAPHLLLHPQVRQAESSLAAVLIVPVSGWCIIIRARCYTYTWRLWALALSLCGRAALLTSSFADFVSRPESRNLFEGSEPKRMNLCSIQNCEQPSLQLQTETFKVTNSL